MIVLYNNMKVFCKKNKEKSIKMQYKEVSGNPAAYREKGMPVQKIRMRRQ